jgi:hypothetical protein
LIAVDPLQFAEPVPAARRLRINSSHTLKERGEDAYFSPPEAGASLLGIEALPAIIHEPACGDGAIARPLRDAGHIVTTSDIIDYGLPFTEISNFLTAPPVFMADGIVTNPPFKHAMDFARKAIAEVPYVALLLRLNWLETPKRALFFRETRLSTVWVSSRRLPMMHRHGYEGPTAPSNCCYAWFIWDHRAIATEPYEGAVTKFFDWADFVRPAGAWI